MVVEPDEPIKRKRWLLVDSVRGLTTYFIVVFHIMWFLYTAKVIEFTHETPESPHGIFTVTAVYFTGWFVLGFVIVVATALYVSQLLGYLIILMVSQ